MSSNRFSIVITCHNQLHYIGAAVDSALSQGDRVKEIIVVDDGSTDGSLALLQQYKNSIQLVSFSTNRGAIEARNQGAALGTGDYLVFLDGDDLFTPWAFDVYETIVSERLPKIILGQSIWFQGPTPPPVPEQKPTKIDFVQYSTLFSKDRAIGLSASTFVIDRQTFHDVGGWSPGIFHLDCSDLCAKLGISGRTLLICSPPTAFYRVHTSNSIHSVPPFLEMLHRLMAKEKAGEYPGGRKHRFERRVWLGGLSFFWTRRALRAGLYKDALRVAASTWPMIVAAISCRCGIRIKGRQPIETIEFDHLQGESVGAGFTSPV